MAGTSFACPSCKKVLKSNTPLPPGRIIKCPGCQNSFPVPASNGQAEVAAPAAAPPPAAPAPAKPAGSLGMFDLAPAEPAAAPAPAAVATPAKPAAAPAPLPKMELPEKEEPIEDLDDLEDLEELDEEDEEDDDDRPRGKKKGRDDDDLDDEDDRPRKKSRDDDDEEDIDDDRPAGKKSRDDDEDDDPPRGKKKGRDDDDEDDDLDDDDSPKSKKSRDEDEDEDDDRPASKKKGRDDDDDDDDDDRPASKKKGRDDDEDEDDDRPASKKKGRDDDEDEDDDRPASKKKGRDDDEDEDDDGPASKKKGRDDDDDEDDDRPASKKKGRDDDDDEDDDRPAGKKKGRDDDDDEDDDRPSKSAKDKKGKKGKKSGGKGKLLILAGVAVVALTLVVGVGGWLAMSLFFGDGALAYLPPDCDTIVCTNLAAFDNVTYKKSILAMHGMLADDDDPDNIAKDLACVTLATAGSSPDTAKKKGKDEDDHFEPFTQGSRKVMIFQTRQAYDPEKVRRKFDCDGAETMEGTKIYRGRAKQGATDKELLAEIRDLLKKEGKIEAMVMPSSKMFIMASLPQPEFKKLLSRSMPAPGAEMLALARKLQNNGVWEVHSLEAPSGQSFKLTLARFIADGRLAGKMEENGKLTDNQEREKRNTEAGKAYGKEFKEFTKAFRGAKAYSITANPPDAKSLKIEMRIDFANEANAKTIEKGFTKEVLKAFASHRLMRVGQLSFNKGTLLAWMTTKEREKIAEDKEADKKETDMEKTIKVEVIGATLSISATVSEETWRKIGDKVEEDEKERNK